jgi:hypothetical protein
MLENRFELPQRLALDTYDEEPKTLEELREELAAELAAEEAAHFFTADVLSALGRHAEFLLSHLDAAAEARNERGDPLDGDEQATLSLLRLLLGVPAQRSALFRLTASVRSL